MSIYAETRDVSVNTRQTHFLCLRVTSFAQCLLVLILCASDVADSWRNHARTRLPRDAARPQKSQIESSDGITQVPFRADEDVFLLEFQPLPI